MKILMFTDPHYSSADTACLTRRPRLSYDKIRNALRYAADVDWVICLGDLVDDCGNREANLEKLSELMAMISSCGKPFFCTMGNHDYTNFTREEFAALTGSDPTFCRTAEGKTFLFLDANVKADGTVYAPGRVDWTDSCLPRDQLDTMKRALDKAEGDVYVFLHQNLDPGVQWQHIVKNADEIRAILAASGKVKTVYQGHYHPGHDAVIDGIRYHTLPAMCEGEDCPFEIVDL